ncbi:MAG: L,D-transpeptidase family protein [Pseudolabrys sp.]|nr:L,D-transpeptidase family protein [Pseudolabrys sp.]
MKSVRFDRLLASTALGLVLVLSSHAAMAQQPEKIENATPAPDTTAPVANDAAASSQATPAPATTETITPAEAAVTPAPELKQEAVAPAPQPAPVEAAVPAPAPTAVAPAAAPPVTTTIAAEPAPAASVVADSAVAERLRALIDAKSFDRIVSRKAERDGVEAFYKARDFAPIWVGNGAATDRARSVTRYLEQADAVGLEPDDYPTPDFAAASTADTLADAEIRLTAAALTFARHAQTGRIHFSRVANDIQFAVDAPNPADVLAKLATATDAGAALDSYNPPQPQFAALRAKLAELRANGGAINKPAVAKPAPVVRIPDGSILRLGMRDDRVIALRKRLDVEGDKNNTLYDEAVREAVLAFQTESDIGVDGNVGPQTVRMLNGGEKRDVRGPSADPVDVVLVNMERWRWFARDLGDQHVIVNVPDYTLTLYNEGNVYWHTRIVVGKPSQATPMISSEMKFITVNPTWNVPPSIIENEYLPALREDPNALERIGLKMEQREDGTVRIYQPPGAANALGRIRFNFPNKFLVYQHDTPDKNLFNRDKRAFSHGCMRVQDPLVYGEKLLSLVRPGENYTRARLEKMFGGSEININFPKNIWVHMTYETAFVDAAGKLQFREDVYGRDARMIALMKGSERRVADVAVARPPISFSKPVRMPAGMHAGSGGGYNRGPNLFDWIFGGAQAQPQQMAPQQRNPRGASNQGRSSFR